MACAALCAGLHAAPAFPRAAWSGPSLPPAPQELQTLNEVTLHLELVVNSLPSGEAVPVVLRNGLYHVRAADLRRANIAVTGDDDAFIAVDTAIALRTEYDAATLQLRIVVPLQSLPEQRIGHPQLYGYAPAQSSPGVLINYDIYASDSDRRDTSLAISAELRAFGPFGTVATTGAYLPRAGAGTSTDAGPQRGAPNTLRRYDTYWRYSDEQQMVTYEAGDFITRTMSWASTMRLGGVQISRDFAIRPDVITYPLPQFSGEAAVPSTVDLFINGYKADGAAVKPGPFTLTSAPFVNGAGEAVVVVTDALGRQASTAVPFYVSNALLRQGLSDFSLAAGFVRRGYGLKNFAYGPAAASASWRTGVSDAITTEIHGEVGEHLALGGVGGVMRLGTLGIINAAWSHSRYKGRSGNQWTVGYQYSMRNFSLTALQNRRTAEFTDLSTYDGGPYSASKTSTSVTGSVAFEGWGSLGAGYFDMRTQDGTRTRLANLSWNRPLWRDASLYASGNYELGTSKWGAALQLVIALGHQRGTVSGGLQQNAERGLSRRVDYNRPVKSDGGFGWSLGYADGGGAARYLQADVTWRDDHVQLRGGAYGNGGDITRWGSATGSLVILDGSTFATNRINDAFAVVSTMGVANVPVRYENQLIGTTNAKGQLLVPWTSSYYGARYSIDPLGLPPTIETPVVEQRVAVRRGSGYLIEFPVSRIVAATVKLHDTNGKPLPLGSTVVANGKTYAYVGWDGISYVEGLEAQNSLTVTLPDGATCTTSFTLDVTSDRIGRLGPLPCPVENKP